MQHFLGTLDYTAQGIAVLLLMGFYLTKFLIGGAANT